MFGGIIDIYAENDIDFDNAWARGVRCILHETGRGLFETDKKYQQRKVVALQKGFLWAGFHLLSAENLEEQLDRFLSLENGGDARVGMAIDWESSQKGTMSFADLRRFIQLFNQRMKPTYPDRYPILYGGYKIREEKALAAGDSLLTKCPLWYQRYKTAPEGIPVKTWPSYALWQFDNEKRSNGGPPKNVLPGSDWNRFNGTLERLQNAWPFAGPTGPAVPIA
jgi:lysozyme